MVRIVFSNKRGQTFVNLIIFILGFLIFIFAAPILAQIIGESVAGQGTATSFVMKLFPWTMMLIFIAVFIRIISSDGGFFS